MKKKAKWKRTLSKVVIILAVLLAAALSIYLLFIKETYIKCGVPTEIKESGRYVRIRISHNDKQTWIKVPASYYSPDDGAYNIEMKGIKVVYMKACEVYSGRLLSIDDSTIYTSDRAIALSDSIKYYKYDGSEFIKADKDDIISGCSNCRIVFDESGKAGAVIIEGNNISTIRVGITTSDFSSLDHESLTFFPIDNKKITGFNSVSEENLKWRYYSGEGMKVIGDNIDYTLEENEMLSVTYEDGSIVLTVYSVNSSNQFVVKEEVGRTQSRVTIQTFSDPVYIVSLKRSNGYKPTYFGSFEIYIKDSSLRLINEVDLDTYLKNVVPGQMVPSGGMEAYKSQAIVSRTCAVYRILEGSYLSEGYHLTDTIETLLYNNQPSTTECSTAIDETAGKVLTYNGKIINAKYYSTSCGTGAPYNEVYYSGRKPAKANSFPYLTFGSYTTPDVTSLKDEIQAAEFLKDWTIKSYDSNSPYYRWKFSLTRGELSDTINSNIYRLYCENPNMFRIRKYLNIYKSVKIPEEGIGTIKDIEVSERGTAGNVQTLTLTCDSGIYRIYGGEIIQQLLTPEELTLSLMYGGDTVMDSIPSPYFTIDKTTSGSTLTSITIYGGGYGDGIGMSQYGAIGLTRSGKTYEDVLNTFYPGTEIKSLEELYPNESE